MALLALNFGTIYKKATYNLFATAFATSSEVMAANRRTNKE